MSNHRFPVHLEHVTVTFLTSRCLQLAISQEWARQVPNCIHPKSVWPDRLYPPLAGVGQVRRHLRPLLCKIGQSMHVMGDRLFSVLPAHYIPVAVKPVWVSDGQRSIVADVVPDHVEVQPHAASMQPL